MRIEKIHLTDIPYPSFFHYFYRTGGNVDGAYLFSHLLQGRLERGYSMTQAARKIFSHPDTYNRYEKGIREIPLDSLMLLAKTYDCSLDYLAGVSDRPRKYGR